MTPQTFFTLLTVIGGIGWFTVIALAPKWKNADKFTISIIISMMAIVYTYLNFGHIGSEGGPTAFMTFDGVMRIFSNPYLVVAGWAHILSLDLVVGMWIRHNAAKCGMKYGVVVLILLLTIAFTPLGLFIYLLARWAKTKHFFVDFE